MSTHLVLTQGHSWELKSQRSLGVCASVQVCQLRVPLSLDFHPEKPGSGVPGPT